MKMKNKFKLSFFLFTILFVALHQSARADDPLGPAGPVGPSTSGENTENTSTPPPTDIKLPYTPNIEKPEVKQVTKQPPPPPKDPVIPYIASQSPEPVGASDPQ